MKKALLMSLGIILLFASCENKNEPKKPENLISQDKMVDILIDLSLLSSAKGLNKKIIENNSITPDEYVYKKHTIDSIQFSESNKYYSYFIDDYTDIYARVKDSLDRLKLKYERLEQTENRKKLKKGDSLKKHKKDSLLSPPNFKEN